MRERLIALRERRAGLLARAEAERNALSGWLARADRVSGWLGAGSSLLAKLKDHPLWIAGAALLLIAVRPKRMLGFALRAWSYWQIVRRARVWWHRFGPAAGGLR